MSTEIALRSSASMAEKVEYCKLLADSGLIPDIYRRQPANVLYAVEYGETIGVPPMAAITGIHIIKGKPSASAGLVGALVRKAGHKLRVRGDDQRARAVIIRADDPDFEYVSEWTIDRAVTARLCTIKDGKPYARDTKGEPTSWEKYPAAMLKHRATTEVARDACEEVLFGLHYTPEELGAEVDAEGEPVYTAQDAADAVVRKAQREERAEPVDEEFRIPPAGSASARPVSDAQIAKIAVLLKEKRGISGGTKEARATRLDAIAKLIGRPVASSKELTLAEASQVIERLVLEPNHVDDAEVVEDAPSPEPHDVGAAMVQAHADARSRELLEAINTADEAALDSLMSQATEARDAGQISDEQWSFLSGAANGRAAELVQAMAGEESQDRPGWSRRVLAEQTGAAA